MTVLGHPADGRFLIGTGTSGADMAIRAWEISIHIPEERGQNPNPNPTLTLTLTLTLTITLTLP